MSKLLAISPLAQIAGGETVLLRLLGALPEHGWDVRMTVPARGRLRDAARKAGIPVALLPLGPPERRSAASYVGVALAPSHVARADVVLLNGLPTQRIVPALALARRRAVLHVNNPLPDAPRAWERRGFWRHVPIIAVDSEHTARECAAAGAPQASVQLALPAAWSTPDPPGAGAAPPAGQRVLFVGQLEPRKGVAELIDAAGEFLRGREDATLTLLGEGSAAHEGSLRAAAAGSGVAGRINFAGFAAGAAAAMTEHDLIVVPSLAEPFGTVAAEAAAAGRPVVASAVGGLSEVVLDGETGLLVAPGDPRALAQAVGSLLDDPRRMAALGTRALERAERFSPASYARRMDELLRLAAASP